ncbi:MAG: gluconate 2-dehydrogenase subunit 3 family protein [Colwellia sp.]|nr:gluconate 2-dehydrogenase subunit 3 family protein [Colwellia sp.]
MNLFLDDSYQTPAWFTQKKRSRRNFLKSAAGATGIVALPSLAISSKQQAQLINLKKSDPWLTLEATLAHLLPESEVLKDLNAQNINALAYLHQVMTVQPTEPAEKAFILKGVSWLNDFSHSQQSKPFVQLSLSEKESILREISNSRAGENWLSTLLNYIFEAMLTPPAYGGNPDGIGWQWLEHQGGFPLPQEGQRYFELPPRSRVKTAQVKPK